MKKGFTLVELSIVLVIIGLLIGGILVGQSLISSAKITSLAKEVTQYSIAMVNFKQKFKQTAGDSTMFSPSGNGDNLASYLGTCPASYVSEHVSAWAHVSQSGMLSKNYIYNPNSSCGANPICNGVAPCFDRGSYFISTHSVRKREPARYEFKSAKNQTWSGYYTLFQMQYSNRFVIYVHPEIFVGLDNKLDASATPDSGILIGGYEYNEDGNYAPCTLDTNSDYYNYIGKSDLSGMDCYAHIYFSPHGTPELPITN